MNSRLLRLQGFPTAQQRLEDAEIGAWVVQYVILPLHPDFTWADLEDVVRGGTLGGWWTDLKKTTWRTTKKASNIWTFGTGETILDSLQSWTNAITSRARKITEAGESAQSLLASIGAIFRAEQSTGLVSVAVRHRWILLGGGVLAGWLLLRKRRRRG